MFEPEGGYLKLHLGFYPERHYVSTRYIEAGGANGEAPSVALGAPLPAPVPVPTPVPPPVPGPTAAPAPAPAPAPPPAAPAAPQQAEGTAPVARGWWARPSIMGSVGGIPSGI